MLYSFKRKAQFICIVPEKGRKSHEGGLNLNYKKKNLKKFIKKLREKNCACLFYWANIDDIKMSKLYYNADCRNTYWQTMY